MLSRHTHSLAVVLAGSTLAVILSGATQLGKPGGEPHRGLSALAGLLSLVLIGLTGGRLRHLAIGCLGAAVTLGAVGLAMANSPWAKVLHACLAHVLFAGTVALAVATAWRQEPARMADTGSPSLLTLAIVTPLAVFFQIFLGAIYRQANLPVWPHLVGSLLVGGLLLYTGMVALETDASPKPVLNVAKVLIGITVMQIALGLGAFLGRVMVGDHLEPEWWMVAARTLHVANGAATLGAAVAYSLETLYHVQSRSEQHPMMGKSAVA